VLCDAVIPSSSLAFGARIRLGSREGVGDGDTPGRKLPPTRVWGEGEGGRREREAAAAAIQLEGNPLAFGARVGMGVERGCWRQNTRKETPPTHIWGEGEGGRREKGVGGKAPERKSSLSGSDLREG
jgi:hypothetical protein